MRVLVVGTPGLEEPDIIKAVLSGLVPTITEVIHNDAPDGVDAAAAQWCVENSIPEIVIPLDETKGAEAYGFNIDEMLAQNPEVTLHFADDEEVPEGADPNWQILPRVAGERQLEILYTNIFPVGTSVDEIDRGPNPPRAWQTIWQPAHEPMPTGPTGPTGDTGTTGPTA